MIPMKKLSALSLLVGIFLFALLISCEGILPEAFQEDDDFILSAMDEKACRYLTCDLQNCAHLPVTGVTLEDPADSVWMAMSDSLISSVLDTLVGDTLLVILNPLQQEKIYAVYFKGADVPEKSCFYISWDLTDQNIDAYITTDIWMKNGTFVPMSSTGMTLESIAGCTEDVELAGQTNVVPKIRARHTYQLKEGIYLINFYLSEPMTIGSFRLAILHE